MKFTMILVLFLLGCTLSSCDDGCVTCSGVTAPQEVCKGDYTDNSYYQSYVDEYENKGGTCE
ncbi:MAG: hypothetical protein K9J17_11125 [Flavobacteriales bacterium]|nr:hypothetical protein [Flavobacteriales bacterium]